ncbi:MAG: hypothetical protein MJ215_05655 [Spirochaetia bacterium]|nr:hypothetical protein [Spirochaetia bacterium]
MLTDSELEKYGVWIKSGPINIEIPQQTTHEEAFVSQKDEFVQAMGTQEHETPEQIQQTSDLRELAQQMQSEISALKEELQRLKSRVNKDSYILEDNTAIMTDDTTADVPDDEDDDDPDILELDTLEDDEEDVSDLPEALPADEREEEADIKKKESEPESEDLKEEVRSVLAYLDQLLESLPDSKIQEFAHSRQFVTYRKLFQKLELI